MRRRRKIVVALVAADLVGGTLLAGALALRAKHHAEPQRWHKSNEVRVYAPEKVSGPRPDRSPTASSRPGQPSAPG